MTLNEQAENLIKELNIALNRAEEISFKDQQLQEREMRTIQLEKAILGKKDALDLEKKGIESQLEFIKKGQYELESDRKTYQKDVTELAEKITSQNVRDEAITVRNTQLDVRIKELSGLEDKLVDLKTREALVIREKEIDKERKLLLDAREERIKTREAQLQKILSE